MAGLLEQELTATLHRWARDAGDGAAGLCAISVLDYVERLNGEKVRPDPRDMGAGALAEVLRSEEALVKLCLDVMRRMGWQETLAPQRGDVGLVRRPEGLTACICFNRLGHSPIIDSWAARGKRMVIIQPACGVLAWAVPPSIREAR